MGVEIEEVKSEPKGRRYTGSGFTACPGRVQDAT
jgi:hypothetical protein